MLDHILAADFFGCDDLAVQVRTALARRIDGSLRFRVDDARR